MTSRVCAVSSSLVVLRECLDAMGFEQAETQKVTVRTFLNRILGLPVVKQNLLFELFMMVRVMARLASRRVRFDLKLAHSSFVFWCWSSRFEIRSPVPPSLPSLSCRC